MFLENVLKGWNRLNVGTPASHALPCGQTRVPWLMADVITHNIDQIVNRLTAFQRTDLPKAARRTVSQLGFDLARKDLPQYMSAVFETQYRLLLTA